MIVESIRKVVERKDLTRDEAFAVMDAIMSGQATDAQIAAFLTALRMKGETVEELIGFARVMREKVSPVKTRARVQTSLSGDRTARCWWTPAAPAGTPRARFNVSTATAFVVAGAGIPVAKHGNRSVSSLCGSADVVEALGVRLDLPPERVGRCVDEVGIGFCYAPLLHKAMKFVMLARREIRIRTVFNILGPLTNPAHASAQVIGVYDGALAEVMAQVLKELGTVRAFVVHGEDGLDELSTTGPSRVAELRDGEIRCYTVQPGGLRPAAGQLDGLEGRQRRGQRGDHPPHPGGRAGPEAGHRGPERRVRPSPPAARRRTSRAGIALAAQAIDSGAARDRLARLVAFCQG